MTVSVVPTSNAPDRPQLTLAPAAPPSFYEQYGKRVFDTVTASALIVGLSPVMGAVIATSRVIMGPGAFYTQERVGMAGTSFRVFKFRTMKHDRRAEPQLPLNDQNSERRIVHKTTNDPRHTRFGRLLRASSVDELPQLFNVVRGEMSLVGPRPELVHVAEAKGLLEHPRHRVRPGITGRWQTSPDRAGLIHENLHHDEAYVAELSFVEDLRILLRTPLAVIRNRGA